MKKCSDCGKSFPKLFNLKRHISFLHSSDGKQVSCDYCKIEMRQSSLKKHQQNCTVNPLADMEKDIFVCDTCNRNFSSKTDLENHVGKVHEKVFHCSQCEATFEEKFTLLPILGLLIVF